MHRTNGGSKKRRAEVLGDVEAERTLYSSFVTAANAMSQLYSQAVQQQRRSAAAASRQTLERVLGFLLRESSSSEVISKAALLQFLQQEYENIEGSELMPQQFPVQFLPTLQTQGTPAPAVSMDDQASPEPMLKLCTAGRGGPGGGLMSPTASSKRAGSGATASALAAMAAAAAMDTTDHDVVSQQQPGVLGSVPSAHASMLGPQDASSKLFVHGTGFGAC